MEKPRSVRCFRIGTVLAMLVYLLAIAPTKTASSGPNEFGSLLLHVRPDLPLSSDPPSGQSGVPSCRDMVSSVYSDVPLVWFVLASFPAAASPDVRGVLYGVHYDPDRLTIFDSGFTDAAQEITDLQWPAPGSMARVNFNSPKRERVFEVGYFVGQPRGTAPTAFEIRAGDSDCYFYGSSAERDRAQELGQLGFFRPYENRCQRTTSCCLPDGRCFIADLNDCQANSGLMIEDCNECRGAGPCCIDGACEVLFAQECIARGGEYSMAGDCEYGCAIGLCCLEQECLVLPAAACYGRGGWYHVEGVTDVAECVSLCSWPATLDVSWGALKRKYR